MVFLFRLLRSLSIVDWICFGTIGIFSLSAARIISHDISLLGDFLVIGFPASAFLLMLIPVKVVADAKSWLRSIKIPAGARSVRA